MFDYERYDYWRNKPLKKLNMENRIEQSLKTLKQQAKNPPVRVFLKNLEKEITNIFPELHASFYFYMDPGTYRFTISSKKLTPYSEKGLFEVSEDYVNSECGEFKTEDKIYRFNSLTDLEELVISNLTKNRNWHNEFLKHSLYATQ